MLLFILSYLGGVLTVASPCILPVLPFVFARTAQPFVRSHLPMLLGMGIAFAAVASLAAVAGGWAVAANHYGRMVALLLLALFGAALLVPPLATRLAAPVVALGGQLSLRLQRGEKGGGVAPSLLLGLATGLLWAPCAGPILGLILTGAALNGPNINTSLLLFAYAAGAATSLGLALFIGGRVLAVMKRSFGIGEWTRRTMGALVLVAVGAITFGLDTGFLSQVSVASTNAMEQYLMDELHVPSTSQQIPPAMMMAPASVHEEVLPVEKIAPPLEGATNWLNSAPLTLESLKGKVVLVDFWTYSCINCLRSIPYMRAWAEKYQDQGLVVVGVHAPEFAFERNIDNIKRAIAQQQIAYPVAVDNSYSIWRAFQNQYWPAHYFIDAEGRIRHHHFGEGDYERSERIIQQLLREAGRSEVTADIVAVAAHGAEAAADFSQVLSPETYLGFERAENFISPGGFAKNEVKNYTLGEARLNEWSLTGKWLITQQHAELKEGEGGIVFRFHARDLHLVLGPGQNKQPLRFKVTIDGKEPGRAHGLDINEKGEGVVEQERLYQLIRQSGDIGEHEFAIHFLDPGVEAYAFTFG